MTTTSTTQPSARGSSAVPLPRSAPQELAGHVAARAISADDVAAVAMLVELARRDDPTLAPSLPAWLAMALAIRGPRDGHTCLDLDATDDWSGDIDLTAEGHPNWPTDKAAWMAGLKTAGPLVGDPGGRTPFILDGTRLYLARSLHEEQEIALRLVGDDMPAVEILLGGPGTGKTTRVATRLIEMLRDKPDTRIALAAPTGKAAARMAEALQSRLHDPKAPEAVRNAPPQVRDAVAAARPVTIHKLLQYRPYGTPRYGINAGNRLDCGLVVVDEASMLSSSLMHHLLEGLGEHTRLLLVGDPDQLASVDAGSVLGDIAEASQRSGSLLHDRTELLKTRHRFGPRIGGLADAILAGDDAGVARAFEILESRWAPPPDPHNTKPDDPKSIRWIEPSGNAFKKLIDSTVVPHAAKLRDLASRGAVAEALAAQKALHVLCAHRSGPTGVAGLNGRVEAGLGVAGDGPWYAGRPLMVTSNNRALNLFNGDVGLVVPGEDGRMDVAFPVAGAAPRRLAVSRLEDVETVHALTIHKSQGSEYEHVIVVLPERASRIVTKELLYTGVTRASEKVTVVGSREVIEAAIRKRIRRATGLARRLAES
jgi:exodeoxyribonuclease V alpha subunit